VQRDKSTSGSRTFLEAAAAVLKPARRPLTASEITAAAAREGLLRGSAGKSPERTMSSALYMDVLHNSASRFVRLAKMGRMRAVRNSVKWALK
jgi:hypothetical protein